MRQKTYVTALFAAEISATTRYYDAIVQLSRREEDAGALLAQIECPRKDSAPNVTELPPALAEKNKRTAVLLNGNLNFSEDIHTTLRTLRSRMSRASRVIAVLYNPYLRWLYALANLLGLRSAPCPTTFLTITDLSNFAELSGFEITRIRTAAFIPWRLFGIGTALNRVLPAVPLVRWCGLGAIVVLRPVMPEPTPPSISVVIPARNERGNIEGALQRMPTFQGVRPEIIFVEGHSKDGTWEEIQRVCQLYGKTFSLKAVQQTGIGKADAVRLGFSVASGELLTVLDADLTMPPEMLPRFYDAFVEGHADFVNGSRLVYPMAGKAMRFLNHLGNIFFAKALSAVLGQRIGDALCGTKLVARHDYERMCRWRQEFGDFDPFGDFELLFPAAELALGVVDVAIRYQDRTYGSTNIRRFRHGAMLLKMTIVGLIRLRAGKAPAVVSAS